MTKTEQVKVIKNKIEFEQRYLDELIKRKEEATKGFEDCSVEEYQKKQSKLDTCCTAVNAQHMYLRGVLSVAYALGLISWDEYDALREQALEKVFK